MPDPSPEKDLLLAGAVQEALLAESVPPDQGGNMVLENRMCREIGGDFYYFCDLGQQQVAFVIGDVVGHGTGAALVMTLILGILRANQPELRRPNHVVELINSTLVKLGQRLNQAVTCTLMYGIVDLPSGLLLYINAGHPEPIIYRRRQHATAKLAPTTMILGVQSGVRPESCFNFGKGDRLILFTDGITDCRNRDNALFGRDRLEQLVIDTASASPQSLANRVFDQIAEFTEGAPRDDDQTVVVVDFDAVAKDV